MNNLEDWKTISGFPIYQSSDFGRVKYVRTTEILKPTLDGRGYLHAILSKDKKHFTKTMYKLIANDFTPKPETDARLVVGHIDRNKLNNMFNNLRWISSHHQNLMNASKTKNPTSSTYKGVDFNNSNSKWIAQIKLNKNQIYIGLFANGNDAALAYNEKATELFNEFACLNVIINNDELNDELNDE